MEADKKYYVFKIVYDDGCEDYGLDTDETCANLLKELPLDITVCRVGEIDSAFVGGFDDGTDWGLISATGWGLINGGDGGGK